MSCPIPSPCARTLAALLVTLVPAVALASGSVTVTVVGKHQALTVRQTYRKILAADQAPSYYDAENRRLLGIAAKLTPRLDTRLARHGGAYDPAAPVARCEVGKTGTRLPAGVRFPALVVLSGFQAKGRERLAYDVGVTFARRPGAAQLAELQRALAGLIATHAGAAEDAPERDAAALPRELAPVVEQGASLRLELQPRLRAVAGEHARLEARLKTLAGTLRAALETEAGRARGVTLAPYDKGLAYYEDTKRLPGLASVHLDTDAAHVVATYALKALHGEDALRDLRRALLGVLARALGQDDR
jgi:hypothetical protein